MKTCKSKKRSNTENSIPASAIEFHDVMADSWYSKYSTSNSFKSRLRCIRAILDNIENLSLSTWVDAGCGAGNLAFELVERGAYVYGYDASKEMISEARHEASRRGYREHCNFGEISDICEMQGVLDGSADGLICSSVIEYLETPREAFSEFNRILKDDGWLILSVPNRYSIPRFLLRIMFKVLDRPNYIRYIKNYYCCRTIRDLCYQTGFEPIVVSFGGLGRGPDSLGLWGTLIFVLARKIS